MQYHELRFAFFTRDFDRSVSFYRDILGMTYLNGWDRPDGKGALLSVSDAVVFEIYTAAQGKTCTGPPPVAINLALRLANREKVDQFFTALERTGIRLSGPPENRAWGHRSFIVYDPDDVPVHIFCELGVLPSEL
jgi:catechol 2,3-dioxygenase-like lactoylglutathione lyase family enzyme